MTRKQITEARKALKVLDEILASLDSGKGQGMRLPARIPPTAAQLAKAAMLKTNEILRK